jgi:mono/diheme cytochrome c family protein
MRESRAAGWPRSGDHRRLSGHLLPALVSLAWAVAGVPASGETSGPAAAPAADTFAQLAPILQRSCGACHGAEKAESELRLDRLDPDLVNGADHGRWRKVFDRLSIGDMPPEDATPLPEADRERLKQWLVRELKRGELARNPPAHFRRLTRLEYERTMQDLLGLPLEFGKRLPEDGRAKSGFRNDGDTLRMSPLQFELFSQIAEEALGQVIVEGPPPVAHRYRFTPVDRPRDNLEVTVLPRPDGQPCETFAYVTGSTAKGPAVAFRIWNMHDHRHAMQWIQWMGLKNRPPAAQPAAGGGKNDAAATENQSASPTPQTPAVEPNPYHMLGPSAIARNIEASNAAPRGLVVGLERAFREDALIRVRVSRLPEAEGGGDPARPPWLALAIGTTNFKGVVLKPFGQPIVIDHDDFRVHEFRVRMENFPSPGTDASADARVLQFNATVLAAWNAAPAIRNVSPSLLRIDWMELETPFIEQWPPANHRAIVPVDGGSMEEAARARQVIERFATRAFRRPLEAAELDRLCGLWKTARADASSFEASLRETLAVVLASPQFLALPATRGGTVSGGATPAAAAGSAGPQRVDDFQLAARLSYFLWSTTPDDRLMEAARSGQLREPDGLAEQVRRMLADPRSWGFFDQFTEQWLELDRLQRVVFDRRLGFSEELAADMRQETVHFVAALVRENRSLFQLVDSPDTFLNQALAGHYGIEGVAGPEFRRVALAPQHRRGGVLAHAAVLAGTSDGVEGHPIKRGMWLVKNLLDEPPPPPPPNVPEIERKDPKNEGLNLRQMLAQHRESKACAGCHRQIDPWGLAFEEYDAVGRWRARPRQKNPADALVELPTGAKIDGLGQLKAELVRSKADVLRRAVSRKLLAYALGRTLNIADVEAADALAARLRDRGDGLGDLVVMIVQSEVFQAR